MEAPAGAASSFQLGAGATVPVARPLIVRVISPAELVELGDPWLELARSAAEPNAFAEVWFLTASLAHLEAPRDLMIVVVSNGDELIGLLPVHRAGLYGRIPVPHVRNWVHAHCFLGTPLVRAGWEEPFWLETLTFLDGQAWAAGFMHLECLTENGSVHLGLAAAARLLGRRCDVVHRKERAFLESELCALEYYERTVRKKKRKELNRLSARLSELGEVRLHMLHEESDVAAWSETFLQLEKSGWKGERGSALACASGTADFFRAAVKGAFSAGRLDFLRLDLDGRPLAMLVNFITPPGSFSFKIAIDESFGRFSPGVLIQLENLRVLERPELRWMDSCAAENHPMINSLWAERRSIVRVTVPLAGSVRAATFRICRFAESLSAQLKTLRTKPPGVGDE